MLDSFANTSRPRFVLSYTFERELIPNRGAVLVKVVNIHFMTSLLQARIETFLWALVFAAVYFGLANHLLTVFDDFGEVSGAIVTRISLRPDKAVPFPSLTISVGGPTDPLGFVRNSGDIVTWDDIEEEGIIWWFNAFKAGC